MKRPLPVTILGGLFIVAGLNRPRLSPFGRSARSRDGPYLDRSDPCCRRRSLSASGSQLGSLADARLARLSRCGERISLAIGVHGAYRTVDHNCLCPTAAARFQIFSVRAIRVRQDMRLGYFEAEPDDFILLRAWSIPALPTSSRIRRSSDRCWYPAFACRNHGRRR